MNWLRIFTHLLPNARAWRITKDKFLRQFFQGLTGVASDARDFFDNISNDLDPQKTRELDNWESQFALPTTGLTTQQRRDRLEATWAALGGQDPRYIQDTLQAAGFDVYVHEWWEPNGSFTRSGGSVSGDWTPAARNPFDYLDDGSSGTPFTAIDGAVDMQDGDTVAQDGGTNVPVGYPLVNKLLDATDSVIGDGASLMQDGSQQAQDGGVLTVYGRKQYVMPADSTTYPSYLYIGGETFPNQASVPISRREEFEDLCLKICPLEQWLGILVTYS